MCSFLSSEGYPSALVPHSAHTGLKFCLDSSLKVEPNVEKAIPEARPPFLVPQKGKRGRASGKQPSANRIFHQAAKGLMTKQQPCRVKLPSTQAARTNLIIMSESSWSLRNILLSCPAGDIERAPSRH